MVWNMLFSSKETCENVISVFHKVIRTGLYLLMPVKRARVSINDAPWMNQHLNSLILKRLSIRMAAIESAQSAFYRNIVNRERKACKVYFCHSKVEHMKEQNPKAWKSSQATVWYAFQLGKRDQPGTR